MGEFILYAVIFIGGAFFIYLNILIICEFFGMAKNIKLIKNKLCQPDDPYLYNLTKAKEEDYLNNKEKAREYLLRAKCHARTDSQFKNIDGLLDSLDNGTTA